MILAEKIYFRLPSLVVALPILLIVFIPRPPIGGAHFIIFPVIAFASALIIFNPSKLTTDYIKEELAGGILFFLLLMSFLVTVSQFVNSFSIRFSGVITIFRPILLSLVFILAIYIAKGVTSKNIKRGLYYTGVVIILGQLVISITQILNIPGFDLIYSSEKARGLGRIFRVTGTLLNPNLFGFIVIQASMMIFLFTKKKTKYLWLFLASLLILASGSRSQLLIFPFTLFLTAIVAKHQVNIRFILKSFAVVSVGLAVLLAIIYMYADTFRYMAQLFILFEGTDLASISSLAARFNMWTDGWSYFLAEESPYKWLIGLGSRSEISVGDNDFFYMFWHYGLIGLFLHLILYGLFFISIMKSRDREVKSLALSSLILLFLLGFQSETLSAWLQPLTVIYYAGLAVGIQGDNFKLLNSRN